MEKLSRFERMGGWIAAAAFAVFAAMVADSALAQTSIKDSKHNLGTAGTGSVRATVGTDEVCVFCHTPHGGDTTRSAPLWNRGVNTGSYTLYDGAWGDRPTSFDGTSGGETLSVGSISLLCLSCHDGATALDLLINAPGSGGYNAAGLSAGYTFQNTVGNTMDPARIATIGTDLRNDHPISVPYCGGRKSGSAFDATAGAAIIPASDCRDPDFAATAIPTNLASGNSLFWVDATGGTTNSREKTDMILYVRAFGGTTNSWPSVECGSCHDPHNADSASATSVAFLRISNTQSQMCLTCHVK